MTLRLGSLCTGYGGLDLAAVDWTRVEPVDVLTASYLARHHETEETR